jgi:hypothetical protein
VNLALLSNQLGVPVALNDIQWKTYIVFCVWCFIQAGVLYFLVPETKNRTVSALISTSPTLVSITLMSDLLTGFVYSSRNSIVSFRLPTLSRPRQKRNFMKLMQMQTFFMSIQLSMSRRLKCCDRNMGCCMSRPLLHFYGRHGNGFGKP